MSEKKEELLPMNEMQNVDENDVNEKSPLKAETETNADGKQNGKEKSEETKSNRAKPVALNLRTRLVIAIVLVTLLMVAIIMTAIGFGISSRDDEGDMEVNIVRFLKLVPSPNDKKQTITFTSGQIANGGAIWPDLKEEIETFLGRYNESVVGQENSNVTKCNEDELPEGNKTCFWDPAKVFSMCNSTNDFGYADGSPCVFIVFNESLNFTADSFTEDDLKNPEVVSANLTEYKADKTYVYVDCTPNTVVDKESVPKIMFVPSSRDFPKNYFTNDGYPDYTPPFIALKFEKPRKNMYIGITCHVYAKNLTLVEAFASTELPFQLFVK